MLERARKRGVYDELQKAELTAFLDASPDAFDVVVSADTFIYFGALERRGARDAARAARRRPRRVLGSRPCRRREAGEHVLRTTGRYAQIRRAIARRVFGDAGLPVVAIVDVVLREESAVPVQGWIVTARRDA